MWKQKKGGKCWLAKWPHPMCVEQEQEHNVTSTLELLILWHEHELGVITGVVYFADDEGLFPRIRVQINIVQWGKGAFIGTEKRKKERKRPVAPVLFCVSSWTTRVFEWIVGKDASIEPHGRGYKDGHVGTRNKKVEKGLEKQPRERPMHKYSEQLTGLLRSLHRRGFTDYAQWDYFRARRGDK